MKSRRHEVLALLGAALAVGLLWRAVFFAAAPRLWALARPFDLAAITPWARSQMSNRDGAEPYALVALVGLSWLALDLAMRALSRLAAATRAAVILALLGAGVVLAVVAPPRPPMWQVAHEPLAAFLVPALALAFAWALQRTTRARLGVPATLAVALLPICLVPSTLESLEDAATILGPALRLANGAALRDVYMQYDLLPTLLALAWTKLGCSPMTFSLVVGAGFYALMLALHGLARRMFVDGRLAAPLVVSLVVVRLYAVILDAASTPQASPIRLDLWILLLIAAFRVGLRHWRVGLVLGLICFFARSMGTLYVPAYALALVADLLAERRATAAERRAPLSKALGALARATAPGWALVALAFVAVRVVFGSVSSDAVGLYRSLGLGMLRTTPQSFYWWLLPLTAAVGCLAFSRRALLPRRYGPAAIFAVALLVASSLYFFGRSHESNLVNLSAGFLFCAFMGIDLAKTSAATEARATRALLTAAPWGAVAIVAYAYSGRVEAKVAAQRAVIVEQGSLAPAMSSDVPPAIACEELGGTTGVFFFSRYDYWHYLRCGLRPGGYMFPMGLAALERPLASQLDEMLARGTKIAVPTQPGDWAHFFPEVAAALGPLELNETPHYRIYQRRGVAAR